ncbi:hypothetical protein AN218_04920 [Streptomyces nanshensis]|uniref:Uncharacterized protein n=2 Tax=Streptomyces nanshensis TaxID=518642 RepID=A0A1E7LAH1_9ACTN|nr:hypothetical protein AN218_04920 [Streptomyces nanshensis]
MRVAEASGMNLSVARLERWRKAGLIPRPGPDTLVQCGWKQVYPLETAQLVVGLLTCCARSRTIDDLALLAFFSEVPVPIEPVKAALARTYFTHRVAQQSKEQQLFEAIPQVHREADSAEYNWAEVAADLDMQQHRDAVRQMRANLKRNKELANATRIELDQRVRGVLIWLNAPALPVHDAEYMADLRCALAFHGPPEQSRAAWVLAALCHSQQRAVWRTTSGEQRFEELMALEEVELLHLRDLVRESLDAMWCMATEGKGQRFDVGSSASARLAGGMLIEWMGARHVHPPGSRPAQVLLDSLRGLWSQCAASADTDASGEGRSAFITRTRSDRGS